MAQAEQILAYLQEHGSIDPRRAVNDLGIYRLGARIWDLKAAGFPIVSEMKTRECADGTIKRWSEYRLEA